jgi:DNA mismatch repair protein MutS
MSKSKDDVPTNIVGDYVKITKEYQEKYGERTILLMQVGAFFEVYGLKSDTTGQISGSKIVDFTETCGLNISEKKVTFDKKQVLMAGFRDYTLDKYLQKLADQGWTTVVYVQEKDGKTVTRSLHAIYSAGTHISYETDVSQQMSNHIMCIWLEKISPLSKTAPINKDRLVYGLATINIFTGKCNIFEHETTYSLESSMVDELERCISIYCPSEVIIISNLDDRAISKIVQYSGIQCQTIHKISATQDTKAIRASEQTYIRHMISQLYDADAYQTCAEFQEYSIATQAFCYLLDFIQEHNPDIVRSVSLPQFDNAANTVLLANHTLKQLNIIDDLSQDGKKQGHLSSVHGFLNKCKTPMGKRAFRHQLVNPTFDESWLNNEYTMISKILEYRDEPFLKTVRTTMSSMRDMEKLARQLVTRKLYPASLYYLYETVQTVQQLNEEFKDAPEILEYIANNPGVDSYTTIQTMCSAFTTFMESNLLLDVCRTTSTTTAFEQTLFQPGFSQQLDAAVSLFEKRMSQFNQIRLFLNQLVSESGAAQTNDFVKVHETDKSGMSLQITKKRAALLKSALEKQTFPLTITPDLCIQDSKEIHFKTASTASNDEIQWTQLDKICRDIQRMRDEMSGMIATHYQTFLETMEKDWYKEMETLSNIVCRLDVLVNKAHLSKKYHYCRPTIVADALKSFVDAQDLRHCLIEQIQVNELYTPNSISLGKCNSSSSKCNSSSSKCNSSSSKCNSSSSKCNNSQDLGKDPSEKDGLLLYGTNAVGKTSFIRSLGISIIMAQAGMYVPCTQFHYKPYRAIFSRILGNDNLFKGLSTFAVEMSELRMILNMSDENSLIMGDELCSGTETESALSIFVSGLTHLHKKGATFIFATHFHEIVHYEEIKRMERLSLGHMSVHYDRALDALVYDRILKEGPGNKTYGLEVCKSLHLPDEFLQEAYAIRAKYFPDTVGALANEITPYNAKKVRGLCEMCQTALGEEIHHLAPQKDADKDGYIGTFHKNHPANLMSVCEACHLAAHRAHPETQYDKKEEPKKMKKSPQRKKTTTGKYILDEDR